jgi:hypothetical protein
LGIWELRDSIPEFTIPEFLNWAPLGAGCKASGHRDAAVGSAWADLAGGFAETEDCTFGVQLHLLQHRLLILLFSALTHINLQDEEWSIGMVE